MQKMAGANARADFLTAMVIGEMDAKLKDRNASHALQEQNAGLHDAMKEVME